MPTNTKMNMRTEPFEKTLLQEISVVLVTGADTHFS